MRANVITQCNTNVLCKCHATHNAVTIEGLQRVLLIWPTLMQIELKMSIQINSFANTNLHKCHGEPLNYSFLKWDSTNAGGDNISIYQI